MNNFGIFALLVGADYAPALQTMVQCMQLLYKQLNDDNRHIFNDMYESLIKVWNYNAEQNVTNIHDIIKQQSKMPMFSQLQYNFLMSLEKKVNGEWQRADIFTRSLESNVSRKLTPTEALASSLNLYGKVNLPHMEERTGMNVVELCDALKEQMYFNPATGLYEEAETWICGNVVRKAREMAQHLDEWKDGEREGAERAIEALKNARPQQIPFADIECQFGSRWIPIEHYKRFICWFFEEDDTEMDSVRIIYSPATDDYVGTIDLYGQYDYKVRNYYANEIIIWALRGSVPNFTYTEDGKSYPDEEARALALKMVDKIKDKWVQFVNLPTNAFIREDIEHIYNERFNSEVKPKIDGSFQTFPDLRLDNLGIKDLYQSQKDCIWMLKKNGGGVAWHEVGTGKTLIMCVTSYEMKRLGLVNKPIIIGMKANVGQIAETYRKAYPNARLLFPSNSDFQSKNRIQFLNQIKNNDWDCIIMSHDQFGRLPLALDTEIRLKQERIDALDDILSTIENGDFNNRVLKGLQKRRERLNNELSKLNDKHREKADKVEDFHELGIDMIFIDESQQFKNLGFETRNARVAGIGNPEGSTRADHLLNCIRDIQYRKNSDLCAAFFSGTIVSNSLTELYLIFNYLRPNALADQCIHSFDAWATVFCEKKTDYETNIVNQVRPKERFSAYVNLPELSKFLSQICDYRRASMCGIDAPKGKTHFEATPPTEQQAIMLDRLVNFVSNGKWSSLGIDREEPKNLDKSLMLVATNVARQVALDPRMLDNCSTFGDEDGNKVRRCAMNIHDIYVKSQAQLGTQFVFNDISTWDKEKWNMQSAIRDVLVNEYGIPASEICFINAVPDHKRLETFEKMNNGEIRVLFGSTTKLGTGVNAQKRCVAVHHLDIPWRPSDMEQRNGRALRQGNVVAKNFYGNEVDVYLYATERTLDGYKFNLLKAKQTFIDQLNNGTLSVRRIDDSILQDSDAVSYAEYVSLLSGNQDLLTKAKLDAKVMALEAQRKTFYMQRNNAVAKIASMESENKRDAEWISLAQQDCDYHKDINADTLPLISGKDIKCMKDAGKELYQIDADNVSKDYKVFGSCGSLQLAVRRSAGDIYNPNGTNHFYIIGHSGQYYTCCMGGNQTGRLLHTGHENVAHYPYDTFCLIKKSISEKSAHIAFNKAKLPDYRKVANSEWDGEQELADLKAELDVLNTKIMESIKDKDKKDNDAA